MPHWTLGAGVSDFLKGLGGVRIGALAGVVFALIGFFVYPATQMVQPRTARRLSS